MAVWAIYMSPTMLTNFGKALAAEHPLTRYLSVENALILDIFPYPDDCKQEMIEFMNDDGKRCEQMWQKQVSWFKKYGINTTTDDLKSRFYWDMRKKVMDKSMQITSATLHLDNQGNVYKSHQYSKKQLENNRVARELIEVQKQNLKAFKAKRKG